MPLLDTNPKNNQSTASSPTPPVTETKSNNLITTIGQLLPLAPFVFEQFTGQKVPALSGTMAEVISSLQQIQTNLQVAIQNQQTLSQRLIALESKLSEIQSSASHQLTTLTQQFQSLRLTHTKEQQQIEYNNPPNLEKQQTES